MEFKTPNYLYYFKDCFFLASLIRWKNIFPLEMENMNYIPDWNLLSYSGLRGNFRKYNICDQGRGSS